MMPTGKKSNKQNKQIKHFY